MFKDLLCKCTAIVLLINPFVSWYSVVVDMVCLSSLLLYFFVREMTSVGIRSILLKTFSFLNLLALLLGLFNPLAQLKLL